MFNLENMNSDGGADSSSAAPSAANAPTAEDAGVSTVEKHPSSGVEASLRKRLRKAVVERPTDASRSTARTSADNGKGTVELGEVPVQGYTMRELCEGEDPLVPRWSTISGSSPFWTEGPLSREYLWRALHPTLAKQVYECSFEELMNRAGKSAVWASVGQELVAIAERRVKELETKIERTRTELESSEVSGGNWSRKVSYEFGYRVALERLRGKHPNSMIELDPFTMCPEDANVEMDLDQPFDDGTPSKKQPTP
ncbi:hypothetical protein BHM03_00050487 [Ensete ventricosum]|nr:hypothetical protein BHM03_00050487 [Ensete ventricosum]